MIAAARSLAGSILGIAAMAISIAPPATAQPASDAANQATSLRNGHHDFDWEIGNWATHVRVLRNPLTGAAPDWAEFRGTSIVKPILGGRANSVELRSTISATSIDRTSPMRPVAQNEQAAAQPTCDEMQSDVRPVA